MYENDRLVLWENDVGLSRQILSVKAKAKAGTV